jgi:hypothetical protein
LSETVRRPPSSIPLALVVLVASLVATALAAGDARAGRPPGEPQGAERRDWWPQVESIEPLLREQKWKRALDRAQRLAEEVQRDAWSGRDLDRLMAELAFLQAVAELNSGRPNDAIWHWYAALNLRPEIARRDLTPYANAARLADLGLRRPGEMPSGTQPPGDLDQLRT